MKEIKKFSSYLFAAFGLTVAMLFMYCSTVKNPAIDWYVVSTTATLSGIFSAWLYGFKKKNDKGDDDK